MEGEGEEKGDFDRRKADPTQDMEIVSRIPRAAETRHDGRWAIYQR
jgi:hypothetical protein